MTARAQRGMVLLITVVLVIALAAFAATMIGSSASSDITDSSLQGYSVEAQFAAETGIERALKQWATGSACTAAALGAANITVVAGRTFTTTVRGTTDFDGVNLPASQCRIQVVGTVTGTNVTRTLQAILDRNLLGASNPGFDRLPLGAPLLPTGWAGGAGRWDATGGPDPSPPPPNLSPPNCSYSAYAVKGNNGGDGWNYGQFTLNPQFTVSSGQTITVLFNYRLLRIGNAADNTCATNPAVPGVSPPAARTCAGQVGNRDGAFCFGLRDTAGNVYNSTVLEVNMNNPGAPLTGTTVGTTPNCLAPTTQQVPAAYGTCANLYQAGATTGKQSVTITIPAGAPATRTMQIVSWQTYLRTAGNAREAWIDNIEFVNATGLKVARPQYWRDCAVQACP
jgi:hypothetical protein